MNRFAKLLNDLKSGTSHSVDFVLNDDIEKSLSKSGIKIRKVFAPLMRIIYSTQTEYKIIIDSREKLLGAKGRIFAINHRQGDDIVIGARAVNKSAYIVFGNKYLALETTNGLGLWAYGMILLDRDSKTSRKATYEKMKYIIEHGGNIIIYPEGYWNLDDNGQKDERHGADNHNSETWLVQDINTGIIRLAKEIGCEIVPTILHYDEYKQKKCYVTRGKPFRVLSTDDIIDRKNDLVEIMQTMYYELMEKYSVYKRSELESDGMSLQEQWEQLKKKLVSDCDIDRIGYKLDLADEKRIGKARAMEPVVTAEEVFGFMDNLLPSKENAFLFRR